MKKSELRRIIREELQKIEEGVTWDAIVNLGKDAFTVAKKRNPEVKRGSKWVFLKNVPKGPARLYFRPFKKGDVIKVRNVYNDAYEFEVVKLSSKWGSKYKGDDYPKELPHPDFGFTVYFNIFNSYIKGKYVTKV